MHPDYAGAPADGSAWTDAGDPDRRGESAAGPGTYLPRLLLQRLAGFAAAHAAPRQPRLPGGPEPFRLTLTAMRLLLFRSLWTNGFDLGSALADCRSGAFDGVEGPVPADPGARQEFTAVLAGSGASFVAEVVTGGGYVPTSASPDRHFDDFRRQGEAALACSPLFLTVLAGCDAWPLAQSVEFYGRVLACAAEWGVVASIETHRSRPTFNPWATRDLLGQLRGLRLTCDFSHWACVCERLVLDEEAALLSLCAARAHHVHARVGYAQGPQVPHPAAPEYRAALEAHERWWDAIWATQAGRDFTTMTPEFGPDGFTCTHHIPSRASPGSPRTWMRSTHWMAALPARLALQPAGPLPAFPPEPGPSMPRRRAFLPPLRLLGRLHLGGDCAPLARRGARRPYDPLPVENATEQHGPASRHGA